MEIIWGVRLHVEAAIQILCLSVLRIAASLRPKGSLREGSRACCLMDMLHSIIIIPPYPNLSFISPVEPGN